jgi:deoxyribodipyrimidine photo-lyase
MQDFIDDRTQLLNDAGFNQNGKYIVYWMQLYKRSQHNRALNKAIGIANALGLPVVVYEGLKYYYPWASDRIHSFILEGVNEKREAFAKLGIRYVFYLQETGKSPKNVVGKIAKEAAALVTDDYPCFIVPGHNGVTAQRLKVPVFTVDDNGIVPMRLLLKEQFAARTIRPRINRLLPDMENLPRRPQLKHPAPELAVDCPETVFTDDEIPALLQRCDIDHSVPAVPDVRGGERAARARLHHVLEHVLPIYEDGRNKPDIDGCSRLSPYMHFGMLSAGEIREAVLRAEAPQGSKDAFLEELVIRRELSFNFCHYNKEYATLDALPDWAKRRWQSTTAISARSFIRRSSWRPERRVIRSGTPRSTSW